MIQNRIDFNPKKKDNKRLEKGYWMPDEPTVKILPRVFNIIIIHLLSEGKLHKIYDRLCFFKLLRTNLILLNSRYFLVYTL